MKRTQQECQLRPISRFFLFSLIQVLFFAQSALADIQKALEPKYSLAVIAYNEKKYSESLKLLNELLKVSPGLIEFLELKALALKSAKDDTESAKTYQALIEAKHSVNAPKKEIAPYEFELGVIHFRAKRWTEAEPHLLAAEDAGFNLGATEFFLGMIAFQTQRFADAVPHFKSASRSSVDELAAPAAFYLAQSYMKNGDASAATAEFVNAKLLSKSLGEGSPAAKNIFEACEQILAPLDHSQKFGSVSLALGYDSNVQALPDNSEGTLNINESTAKTLIQAGIGYMTSPTENLQWVPSYSLSYNKNFNRSTLEGEFLSQSLSIYLNRRPLDPENYGLKADLSHTFQNQFNTGSTTSGTFRPFSFSADFDAYYRRPITKNISLHLEGGLGPEKYFGDGAVAFNEQRSGLATHLRAGFNHTSISRFVNPSLILMISGIDTKGTDYGSNSKAVSLQNGLVISERLKSYLSISVSQTKYDHRQNGLREDNNYVLGIQTAYQINSKWNWVNDASVGRNLSLIPEYQYSRWTFSSGVSYSLF